MKREHKPEKAGLQEPVVAHWSHLVGIVLAVAMVVILVMILILATYHRRRERRIKVLSVQCPLVRNGCP